MASESVKYFVFIAILFLIFLAATLVVANIGSLYENAFWIILAIAFVLIAWKGDILLMLKEYQRAVIMRFGKVKRVGGPGWCLLFPFIEKPTVVDLRTQTIDVPKQDVVTKGNIELKVDAVIYLRIRKDGQSVINSVVEVENYKNAISLYIVSSIRDIIGGMTLAEVITSTEAIEENLQNAVEQISKNWGIEIVSVDLKDVDIPKTVLEAMHLEKAAEQNKLARMEDAKAHEFEIETVKRAAEQLSDRALAYYYVKALEKLGEGKSTKFLFPMEITRLAESIAKGTKSSSDVESLFKKYAPAVTSILSKQEKQRIKKKAIQRKAIKGKPIKGKSKKR